jgi:hypothetical protein
MAITVGGDAAHPKCDTFFAGETKGGIPDLMAGVGACKVGACTHNQHFQCMAPMISVGPGADEADCLTFKQR